MTSIEDEAFERQAICEYVVLSDPEYTQSKCGHSDQDSISEKEERAISEKVMKNDKNRQCKRSEKTRKMEMIGDGVEDEAVKDALSAMDMAIQDQQNIGVTNLYITHMWCKHT